MINPLNSEEMTEVVRAAFAKLSPDEQKELKKLANKFRARLKEKYPGIIFGEEATLELLACLGMAMNDNRLRLIKP